MSSEAFTILQKSSIKKNQLFDTFSFLISDAQYS